MKKQRILKIANTYYKESIEKTKEGGIKRECAICSIYFLCLQLPSISNNLSTLCSTPRLKNARVYYTLASNIDILLYELSLEDKEKKE